MNLTPALTDAHILIVDDDERIRGLLKKFLTRNGFFVSAARDAAHARRLFAVLAFDMIGLFASIQTGMGWMQDLAAIAVVIGGIIA